MFPCHLSLLSLSYLHPLPLFRCLFQTITITWEYSILYNSYIELNWYVFSSLDISNFFHTSCFSLSCRLKEYRRLRGVTFAGEATKWWRHTAHHSRYVQTFRQIWKNRFKWWRGYMNMFSELSIRGCLRCYFSKHSCFYQVEDFTI